MLNSSYIFNVDDYLSHSAINFADKTAIVDNNGTRSTTFAQLNDFGKRLGTNLIELGLERAPILIILPKCMEVLACFAGVTKSNNFYTVFDESTPLERLHKVIKTFKPKVIICRVKYKSVSSLRDFVQSTLEDSVNFIYVEDIPAFSISNSALESRYNTHIDTDLLYVLFTSGSTGEPKGVTISHRSVIDYTEWLYSHFNFSSETSFLNQAPFYFDNSITDIYSTFKTGATLHIIDSMLFSFPVKVVDYIIKHQITTIFWVPSVLCHFANTNTLACRGQEMTSLRQVIFCGEPMPNKQLNEWRRCVPWCSYTNLYGPTEITDVCAYYDVQRNFTDNEILPIGFPCQNTQLLVLQKNVDPLSSEISYSHISSKETGRKGVLYVRGTSLSLGYYNNKTKTKERFIQNPLHDNYLDLIYNTGDIVAYNDYGELVCFGREDNQIKYQGHRIELGEIEAIVTGCVDVTCCACVFTDQITLFYSSKNNSNLDIKSYLKDKLPSYMIPTHIVKCEKFALNQNGKIDRKKLLDLVDH